MLLEMLNFMLTIASAAIVIHFYWFTGIYIKASLIHLKDFCVEQGARNNLVARKIEMLEHKVKDLEMQLKDK